MSLSKLSLSRLKAERKRQQSGTPPIESAPVQCAPASKASNGTSNSNSTGQQRTAFHRANLSVRRLLDSDSDWDSDSEPSGGAVPQQSAPAAAVPASAPALAAATGRPAAGREQQQEQAQQQQHRVQQQALAPAPDAQPRLSEIYELDCLSSDDEENGGAAANCAPADPDAPACPVQAVGLSAERPAPTPAGKPSWLAQLERQPPSGPQQQQPVGCQQPQHRKRSFEQEAGQPAPAPAPGSAHPPSAPPAPAIAAAAAAIGASGAETGVGAVESPEYIELKAWLQGIGLGQYFEAFVREEVDLSVMHSLTQEEYAGILGVTHRGHQQALLAAAQQTEAAQRARRRHQQQLQQQGGGQRGLPGAAAAHGALAKPAQQQHQQQVGGTQQPLPAWPGWGPLQPQHQQQHQQGAGVAHLAAAVTAAPKAGKPARGGHQSLLQVWQANSAAAVTAVTAPGSQAQQQQQREPGLGRHGAAGDLHQRGTDPGSPSKGALAGLGSRPRERALLAQLYPEMQQPQRQAARLPALRPSAAGGAARVPAAASLWAAAAECRRVLPGMEQRLARRRAEAGLDGEPAVKLARGGTAYPQVEESRALKVVKLQALRQELAMHEETVAALRSAIHSLEEELGVKG